MGQIFLPENIPSVVKASTTSLTLAATNGGLSTRMNIGGQQYAPSATITLSTGSTGANGLDTGSLSTLQLWYVYAIVHNTTFVPALVASLSVPSSGPTMPSGYGTAYKLVGAFYSDSNSQVGATVTITGKAESDWFTWNPTGSWTSGITYTGKVKRDGDQFLFTLTLTINGAVGPSSTSLSFNSPFTIDTSKLATSSISQSVTLIGNNHYGRSGSGRLPASLLCNSSSIIGILIQDSTTNFESAINSTVTGGSFLSFTPATNDFMGFEGMAPVSGWTTTLL